MKKILSLLLVMVLALTLMVGCDKLPWNKNDSNDSDNNDQNQNQNQQEEQKPAADADLKAAYDFVHNTVKEIAESTNADYTLPGVAPVKNLTFTVTWTVSDSRITLETSEDGTKVTVKVPEPGDADIPYTLKFVVTNAKGETLSREYNHIVPKFKVNTYAEYRAAEDGTSLVVEGVVYGIMSKAAGDSENSVFVQDLTCGGGYYVYQLSDDEVAKAVIGQTVKVKGNKKAYYDLPEIVDATLEVIKTDITTLTPSNITEIYKSVDNATDKDSPLLDYVGGYVTINGVTLLEAGTNGYYYFELDGVKTYFRISSSSNCSTKDDETKIKDNHSKYFYYTADITGIATLYKSGEEYWFNIMPLGADMLSNFSEEMQPMPDDVKAQFILDKLTTPSEMVSTAPVTLPEIGTSVVNMSVFADVDIAWNLAETANATLAQGVLTAVLPESGSVNITLTATVSVNGVDLTKDFTIAVKNVAVTSIPDANTTGTNAGSNYTTDKYIVEGFITKIASDKYGNVYIKDADGNELYVYGIYSAYGDDRYDAMKKAGAVPEVGDKVVLYGILGTYNSTVQMKNAWLLSWEHVHTYNTVVETVEATCGDGYTVYSCYCGEKETRDIVSGTGEHNYEKVVGWHPEMVAADCVTVGVDVYMCSGCHDYYTQETAIDPDAHAFWGESVVLVAPSCVNQTNGTERVSCANGCGATEDQEVSYYWAHEWEVVTDVEATCTADGEFKKVCNLCEEVETEDRPATGHWSWNYNVTCGDTDVCEGCGVEYTIEHNTNFTPATCTQAAFCMRCYSYVGEPNGHDWDETDPTSVCSVCGLSNHTCDFSVKGETVNPTCTDGGYTIYGCSVEGCTETENKEPTAATNHEGTTEEKDAVVPTCSAVGYTAGVYCTACETWLEGHEEQAIDPNAHKDDNLDCECDYDCGNNVIPAADSTLTIPQANALGALMTTTDKYYLTGKITGYYGSSALMYGNVYIQDEDGNEILIYGLQSADGSTRYDALAVKPVIGDVITVYGIMTNYKGTPQMGTGWIKEHIAHEHNYSEGACLATQVCSICNAAKGDHSYDEGVVTTAATCSDKGVKTYTCACTATKTESIDKLGHSYTGEGGVCVNCGETEGDGPSVEETTVTAKHNKTATGNLAVGNPASNATDLGLDSSVFTVNVEKCGNSTAIGMNKDGTIRLYASKSDGNGSELTISVADGCKILSIKITYGTQNGGCKVMLDDGTVIGTNTTTSSTVEYIINAEAFVLKNISTLSSSNQVYIKSIEITYEYPVA